MLGILPRHSREVGDARADVLDEVVVEAVLDVAPARAAGLSSAVVAVVTQGAGDEWVEFDRIAVSALLYEANVVAKQKLLMTKENTILFDSSLYLPVAALHDELELVRRAILGRRCQMADRGHDRSDWMHSALDGAPCPFRLHWL